MLLTHLYTLRIQYLLRKNQINSNSEQPQAICLQKTIYEYLSAGTLASCKVISVLGLKYFHLSRVGQLKEGSDNSSHIILMCVSFAGFSCCS